MIIKIIYCFFFVTESGTMESISGNLEATDELVPSLQQVNSNHS